MERQTTLFLRKMPERLVREAKAEAARRGTTLTTLVSEALEQKLHGEPPFAASPVRGDMEWFEKRRAALAREYKGQHLAIKDGKVVDHDDDFARLAYRVWEQFGREPIFMPKATAEDEVVRIRPRLRAR